VFRVSVEAVAKRCGHMAALSDVSLGVAAGKLTSGRPEDRRR
jgi:hypothetical protein